MGNGISACTGQKSRDSIADDRIRQFMARLGSECIRVGQKLGHKLEEMYHLDPEIIARAGEGDAEAKRVYDENRLDSIKKPGGGEHRPSMGQDMVKGRRTEIEFMNGLVVEKGKELGIATPANAVLTNIVKRVERGELKPDKSHITGLRESC
jgi:2-dehydropantoate 2-reductase